MANDNLGLENKPPLERAKRWINKLLDGALPAIGGQLGLWAGRGITVGLSIAADWLMQWLFGS